MAPPPSPPAHGSPTTAPTSLTLVVLNCYLIPSFYVRYLSLVGDPLAVLSCRDQALRAERVAELVRAHDVACLQEVWGGATDVLQRALDRDASVRTVARGWCGVLGTGLLAETGNTLRTQLLRTGGLFHAYKPRAATVVWFTHITFAFNAGEELMNKSASFQVYDASARWGAGASLLVVNTHLHSPEPFGATKARVAQRAEMVDVLRSLPGLPELAAVDWSRCAGLLVGDLNTASAPRGAWNVAETPSEEYVATLREFDARDLFVHNDRPGPQDVHTFDARNSYVDEKALKDASRMDYVLALGSLPGADASAPRVPLMRVRAKRCDVLAPSAGQEPSDHHAHSVELVVE